VSEAVADVHRARHTHVVYPPIAFSKGSDLADAVPTGAPTVLVVARFAPGKGLGHLPLIVQELVRRRPSAHVLIAGDGVERSVLEDEFAARDLGQAVTMLGFRSDVGGLHSVADIYLSTSEAEGLVGYATLEAAVAGIPIVASPIPAVAELLRHEQDALLVDPADAPRVASAVLRLADDRALANRLVASARRRVDEKLNTARARAELLDVYHSLL
jgi:glycosyltransferase involved in cell wall biosynthesis